MRRTQGLVVRVLPARSMAWRGPVGAERRSVHLDCGDRRQRGDLYLLKTTSMDPLPHRDANRLVTVVEESGWSPSVSEFVDIRARCHTLEEMAFTEHHDMELTGTA